MKCNIVLSSKEGMVHEMYHNSVFNKNYDSGNIIQSRSYWDVKSNTTQFHPPQ